MMNKIYDLTDSNLENVVNGILAGVPISQSEEINKLKKSIKEGKTMIMTPNGIVKEKGDSSVNLEDGNYSEMTSGTFAADYYDQWYKNNPVVFSGEIAEMKKHFPDAKMGFLESTGNMYWIVKLNITETDVIKPYNVMLMYDKNHPSNCNYGGSIKSVLLDPDVSELREKARRAGRNRIPHLLGTENSFVYLCTRLPEEIQAGKQNITAVQAAGFAADWLLSFELGLLDRQIWNNKFCGQNHMDCWV